MTLPRYYRPAAPWMVHAAILLALGIGLLFAARATVGAIRQGERDRLADQAAVLSAQFDAERARLVQQIDSMSRVTAKADTVLRTRLRTVHDTAWIPIDTNPAVRYAACRAQLDSLATDCEAFRASVTATIAATTSAWEREGAAHRATMLQLAAARRDAERQAVRQTWERRACLASVAANVLQWRMR